MCILASTRNHETSKMPTQGNKHRPIRPTTKTCQSNSTASYINTYILTPSQPSYITCYGTQVAWNNVRLVL